MSCEDRQELLQDLASGEISAEARRELKAHLEICPACRRDLSAYRMLFQALPTLPEPAIPVDLSEQVMAAVRSQRKLRRRPEREHVAQRLIRRTVLVASAAAFVITLGTALWGWSGRILAIADRSLSRGLVGFWETAKELWALLQLGRDLVTTLEPVALNIWAVLRRVGDPLAGYGPIILAAYLGVLLIGSLLFWRALSLRDHRRLGHAS